MASALDAQRLKARYQQKWRLANLRERFVYDYLNAFLLEHGFVLEYSGLGAGDTRLLERFYSGVEEAFDFKIKRIEDGRLVGFLDATGYADPRHAVVDSKRCIGVWKLWKAEQVCRKLRLGLRQVWFAHFTDTSHILVFINAERLKQLIDTGRAEKRRLYRDEHVSYCLPLRYWIPPARFIEILVQSVNS